MTKKEKQLLLKDLCARLPYGVKVMYEEEICDLDTICSDGSILLKGEDGFIPDIIDSLFIGIDEVKPYLRSMSTMTNEEYNEYSLCDCSVIYDDGKVITDNGGIDWLMYHHFDYRGLIEMGLALEAPKEMYKN